jgi:exopolysaccharide production protein ExoY
MSGRERAAALRLRPFDFHAAESEPRVPSPAEAATEAVRPRGGWAAVRPNVKRAMDLAGSLVLLLLTTPVFLVLVAMARLDGGPAFYVHRRIGRDGRAFGCIKFRTMVPDADRRLAELLARDPAAREEWQATRKLKADPRITRRGRLLRTTSLDELPQLINVLKGEMSLVGPRPVVLAELETLYGAAAPLYLSVRPGLTGPWQVSGRNDAKYEGRVALDVAYVRNPSLLTDIVILLRTVGAVLRRRGAY